MLDVESDTCCPDEGLVTRQGLVMRGSLGAKMEVGCQDETDII